MKEIFFKKSSEIKTFDFRKCNLKKPLNDYDIKNLAE